MVGGGCVIVGGGQGGAAAWAGPEVSGLGAPAVGGQVGGGTLKAAVTGGGATGTVFPVGADVEGACAMAKSRRLTRPPTLPVLLRPLPVAWGTVTLLLRVLSARGVVPPPACVAPEVEAGLVLDPTTGLATRFCFPASFSPMVPASPELVATMAGSEA